MPESNVDKAGFLHSLSEQLYRHIRLRILLGLALTSLMIGAVATGFLYQSHGRELEAEAQFQVKLSVLALESELTRLRNLTRQITSRSRIRQELERYNAGEIELQALRTFSEPKLTDALKLSDDMLAINRISLSGDLLVQVGAELPRSLWPQGWRLANVAVGVPDHLHDRKVLVMSAPIINRRGLTVGIDLVGFDTRRLTEILQGFKRPQAVQSRALLISPDDAGNARTLLANSGAQAADGRLSPMRLRNALSGDDGRSHGSSGEVDPPDRWVSATQRLDGMDWVLVMYSERNNFYRTARDKALVVGLTILLLMATGGGMTYLLVRPVAGRISVETGSFKQLLRDRENLLEDVRASEARLQSILDNTPALIYLKDLDGRYRLVNKSFQRLLGLPSERILGNSNEQLFPAEFATLAADHERRAIECMGSIESDERLCLAGAVHDYLAVTFPIMDARSEPQGVCGILTDISERKKTEQELLLSEERFNLAMRASNDGLWDWHLDTNVVYYSPRWKAMLGYAADELENQFSSWEALVDGEGKERVLELVQACLRGEKAGFSTTFRMRHKLGYWLDILSRGLIVRDESGKPQRVVGTHQDISERIRDEQALRESKARLHEEKEFVDTVLQAAGNIIVVLNRKGYFERFNQATEELTGYRFEEIRDKPFYETVIPPESRDEVKAVFSDLLDEKVVRKHQNEWLMKDGSRRLIDWHNTVLTDANGNLTHVVAQGYDITDIRRTEKELQEHRDTLESMVRQRTEELEATIAYNRTLFQTSPIGLALCDMNGRLADVNPGFLKIIGYSEQEAKSLSYWDITPEEYEAQEAAQLLSLRETGFYGPYEKEYIHKDGYRVPVRLNGLMIEQRGESFIWSSVEDVSELKAQQSQLETVIENLPAVFFIKDEGGRHLLVNRRFEEAVGIRKNEVLGRTDRELFSAEVADQLDHTDTVVLATREASTYEERLPHPDGQVHEYLTTKVPLFNEHTQAFNLLGIAIDITELKQLQHELSGARDRAEQLARAKSVFLANMSHEIRTPMNAVLGFAKMGLRDSESESLTEKFRHILTSGEHLLGLLNDILDLSKIDAGKMEVSSEPVALFDTIDEIAKLFAEQASCKNLRLEVDTDPGLPRYVLSDVLRLRQVLVNLMSNAIKFTDRGTVSLQVSRFQDEIRFTVQDTGVGIDEQRMEGLFQPFDQGDSSTTRRFGGTGLGLAISHNLARLMGGDVKARSKKGVGSSFTLCLPLREADEEDIRSRSEAAKRPGAIDHAQRRLQGLRILAVEDVDLNRIILQDLLEAEGAEVVFAENGRQAVDQVELSGAESLDAVLMDIQMPVMDGYEATRRIQQMAPRLPVIGLTAHALREERERCLAVGMVEHITKPFDVEQIVLTLLAYTGVNHRPSVPDVAELPPDKPRFTDLPPDSLAGVDIADGMRRFNGRWSSYRRLLLMFREQHRDTCTQAQEMLANGEWKELERLAHSIKGNGGNLGAGILYEAASALEQSCKAGDGELISTQMERFCRSLGEVVAGLGILEA